MPVRKPKPYAEEVAAIKERIRAEKKKQVGELRRQEYYFVLACTYTRETWGSIDNAEKEHTTRFYIGPDVEYDDGRGYYASWHIHLSQDLTSANVKKFTSLQQAVEWSRNLPFKTEVEWRSR